MKMILVFILCLPITTSTWADEFQFPYVEELSTDKLGGWASGGGNAVACFGKGVADEAIADTEKNNGVIADRYIPYITSVEMYDLYEARLPRGLNQLPPELVKIQDNELFHQYMRRVSNRFFNGPVTQVNNINTVIGEIDTNACVISTMAIQRNINNYFTLYIDARLFNHRFHSRQSQATLMLHEYIYTQARLRGQETSAETRELVGYVITKHPSYTIDYLSFVVEYLGFYSRPSLYSGGGGALRVHLAHSNLVETASAYMTSAYKEVAKYFHEGACVNKCIKLVEEFNKIPNMPSSLSKDMPFTNIIWLLARMEFPGGQMPSHIVQLKIEAQLEFERETQELLEVKFQALSSAIDLIPVNDPDKQVIQKTLLQTKEEINRNIFTQVFDSSELDYLLSKINLMNFGEVRKLLERQWFIEEALGTRLVLDDIVP